MGGIYQRNALLFSLVAVGVEHGWGFMLIHGYRSHYNRLILPNLGKIVLPGYDFLCQRLSTE